MECAGVRYGFLPMASKFGDHTAALRRSLVGDMDAA